MTRPNTEAIRRCVQRALDRHQRVRCVWIRPDISRAVYAVCEIRNRDGARGWAEVSEPTHPGWNGEHWTLRALVAPTSAPRAGMMAAFHLSAIEALHGAGQGFGYQDIADRVGSDRHNYRTAVRGFRIPSIRRIITWVDAWNRNTTPDVHDIEWSMSINVAQPSEE